MQKLTNAIRDAVETISPHDGEARRESPLPGGDALIDAAGAWSMACLREFNGELLAKGLAISKAIADFVSEAEASILDKQPRQ